MLAESLKKNYSTYVYDTFVNYGFDMNKMKQQHFDAFVSFYYNTGSLSSKTIFTKYINGDSLESIAEVWKTTNIMTGTQFEEGLRNRRKAEVNIFLNGEYYYKDIPNLMVEQLQIMTEKVIFLICLINMILQQVR